MTSSDNNSPDKLADALVATLQTVIETLQRLGVKYALMGGLAVVIHGRVRTTKDIDVLLAVPQLTLPRLLDDLTSAGFPIEQREAITRWNSEGLLPLNSGSGVRVDFMKVVLPVFDRILSRASDETFHGMPIRVVDVEGLLLLKLIAFRPQDQLDIRGLLAANLGRIDLDWVRREWSELSGLDPARTSQFEEMVQEFSDQPAQ